MTSSPLHSKYLRYRLYLHMSRYDFFLNARKLSISSNIYTTKATVKLISSYTELYIVLVWSKPNTFQARNRSHPISTHVL